MISDKQLEANRSNALKSTGPKTELGKSIASKNSTTHGLLSKHVPAPLAIYININTGENALC